MDVETRERSWEVDVESNHVVDSIASLLENLRNLNAWWYTNYSFKPSGNSAVYRVVLNTKLSAENIVVVEPGRFQRLYTVDIDEPFMWNLGIVEGLIGVIDVSQRSSSRLEVHVFRRSQPALVVKVTGNLPPRGDTVFDYPRGDPGTVFEYPPGSLVSMLFYLLNPEVERFVRGLAKEHLTSEEAAEALDTWSYTYDKVMEIKVGNNIPPASFRYNALTSYLSVGYSSRYRVLSLIEIMVVPILGKYDEFDINMLRLYRVDMKKRDTLLEFTMKYEQELAHLLEEMVPRSDISALSHDVPNLLNQVRKVPVLVKVIETLDENWFKKIAKLFQK
ncbi:MAG: hypothetical protein QXJ97_01375 [Desulfurococcaceae archaeon]